jgi:hypothetical protein
MFVRGFTDFIFGRKRSFRAAGCIGWRSPSPRFEDERYLSLHADVRAAEINPRRHFLVYGIAEGRRYK